MEHVLESALNSCCLPDSLLLHAVLMVQQWHLCRTSQDCPPTAICMLSHKSCRKKQKRREDDSSALSAAADALGEDLPSGLLSTNLELLAQEDVPNARR